MALVQLPHNNPPECSFVKQMEAIKCPLCQQTVSGIVYPIIAYLNCYNYENIEYSCVWSKIFNGPLKEIINHSFNEVIYSISITPHLNQYITTVQELNINIPIINRKQYAKEIFRYIGEPIDFYRKKISSQDEFLRKLNQYALFS